MKRPSRADMPLALTLPLHFDLRLRARQRRWRRLAIGALLLGAAALAAGFLLPARGDFPLSPPGCEREHQKPSGDTHVAAP